MRRSAFLQTEASPQAVSATKNDPACLFSGMFVQPIKFVEADGRTAPSANAYSESEATLRSLSAAKGHRANISINGQDQLAQRQRPFGLAKRARRVILRGSSRNKATPPSPA
jgi:hypothetical protein